MSVSCKNKFFFCIFSTNLILLSVSGKVSARKVTITGPRGSLTREFRHLMVDISMPSKSTIKVEKWFGKRKELAAVRTVCSHIENMIKGVTKVRKTKIRTKYLELNCETWIKLKLVHWNDMCCS